MDQQRDVLRDELVGTTVLGRYRIVARLARGGMGVVFLARVEGAAGFAKPVVVKRVLPDLTGEARMARLFVREAKILANLQHPNIVSVIDFGDEDGAYIMVLDYVRAHSLGLWLDWRINQGDRSPVGEMIHVIIKVLEALEYAHTLTLPDGTPLEIVHADISPANILVDNEGQVKLLDFGIARMRGEATKTDSKSVRGKFAYLPIEALDGSPPKVTTDVYACGVCLYELLAGNNPFDAVDETRIVAKVISHEPPPISQVRPDVPPELDGILARAMSKDLTKRFASAKEFARELRRIQRMPEDEATTALAAMAKRDYGAIPSKPGTSLVELEEAWRNPPAPEDVPKASFAASQGGVEAQRARGRGSRTAAIIATSAAVLVVAAVVIAVVMTRRSEADDKFVFIERNGPSVSGSVTSSAASSTTTQGTEQDPSPTASRGVMTNTSGSASEAAAAQGSSGSRPTKRAPAADPLSAALAKNQPEIEACFQNNTSSMTGNPEVSVRITIDTEGTVQRVELLPPELGGTPLGQCVIGVARRTRFPAQAAPATFRIPLRARKLQ
jgi:serine/threonine protein kinase